MKLNKKIVSVLTMAIVFLMACQKNGHDNIDDLGPTITLIEPNINTVYQDGDTVFFHVEIKDNDQLHDIAAEINRTVGDKTNTVWNTSTHSHNQTYELFGYYTFDCEGADNTFELVVNADDHNGNANEGRFPFVVN